MNHEKLAALCHRYQAIILAVNSEQICIAINVTPSQDFIEALEFASNRRIVIESWDIERLEKFRLGEQFTADNTALNGSAVQLVNYALNQAAARRASDLHVEPDADACRIRLRIDGVLHPLTEFPTAQAASVVARFKILGSLDIAERRIPQDGQFNHHINGEKLSLRISTLPCLNGEKIVLRLLRQQNRPLTLEALGMPDGALKKFEQALASAQGLILVTGPTGSGKTLTLYSALHTLNKPSVNISCVEDPIELPLPGLTQTQIHPRAGITFQTVLRALLRQDPDIIMVGEIRDGETAEIAVKAAQTGHLVLSTVHTNSAAEALTRLEQMGIARWQLTSALRLIIAQRLVRRLCPHCREEQPPANLPASLSSEPLPHWSAKGCERCYSGYYDRLALFEILVVNEALKEAILANQTASVIEDIARRHGTHILIECGLQAVREGLTTLEEVWRVLGVPHVCASES